MLAYVLTVAGEASVDISYVAAVIRGVSSRAFILVALNASNTSLLSLNTANSAYIDMQTNVSIPAQFTGLPFTFPQAPSAYFTEVSSAGVRSMAFLGAFGFQFASNIMATFNNGLQAVYLENMLLELPQTFLREAGRNVLASPMRFPLLMLIQRKFTTSHDISLLFL